MKTINMLGFAALFLVVMFLACASTAFGQVPVPGVNVTRTKDTMPKQVSETAIVTILNKEGKPVASRPIFDVNLPPCELYKSAKMWLDYRLANVVTDKLEATFFPDTTTSAPCDKDGKEAAPKPMYDTLKRIDIGGGRDYKSQQNLYSGALESLKTARVGYNSLSLRSITHHANHTELGRVSDTDWRRNYLNSDLSVIVVDECEGGQLLLMAKANGYRFNDPKVDAKLAGLLAAQQQPQQAITETRQGQTDQQATQDTQVGERGNGGDVDADTRTEEPIYQVRFSFEGKVLEDKVSLRASDPDVEKPSDQRLEIMADHDQRVEIYQVFKDGSDKRLDAMDLPANLNLRPRFTTPGKTPGKFRVEVWTPDYKRLINWITVEVK